MFVCVIFPYMCVIIPLFSCIFTAGNNKRLYERNTKRYD